MNSEPIDNFNISDTSSSPLLQTPNSTSSTSHNPNSPNHHSYNRTFISHNIQGGSHRKIRQFIRIMKKEEAVVGCVQESWEKHTDSLQMCRATSEFILLSNPSQTNFRGSGTLILIKKEWCISIIHSKIFAHGYTQAVIIATTDNTLWVIINVYVPPNTNDTATHNLHLALYSIFDWLGPLASIQHRIIILGDFNYVRDGTIDRSNSVLKEKDAEFYATIEELQLFDVFRVCNPTLRAYTRKIAGHKTETRIDYILSRDLHWTTSTIKDTALYASAHRYITATTTSEKKITETRTIPPLRRWNFSNQRRIETYQKQIESINLGSSPENLIRSITKIANDTFRIAKPTPYSAITSEDIKDLENRLENAIGHQHQDHKEISRLHQLLNRARTKAIRLFMENKTLNAAYDRSNKLLFNLFNWRKPIQYIWHIIDKSGNPLSDPNSLINTVQIEFDEYFRSFDTPNTTAPLIPGVDKSLKNIPILHPIALDDVIRIIKQAKKKTPGYDKITDDMFFHAGPKVHNLITSIINDAISLSTFDRSLKLVQILPLPKVNNPRAVKDYRPIGLLPTLLKYITSAINKQLVSFLDAHNIISPEQQAFLPNRSTVQHGRLTKNIIEDARRNGHTLWILSVDKENAYGSVSHKKMIESLEILGFHKHFIDTIKALYTDFEAQVITAYGITPKFVLKGGTIQGDPLSCLLFNICNSEPLIRTLTDAGGYRSPTMGLTRTVAITSYVDDDDIYASNLLDLRCQFSLYQNILDWMESKLKNSKCKLTLICPKKLREKLMNRSFIINGEPIEILKANDETKALGFPISASRSPKAFRSEIKEATKNNLNRILHIKMPSSTFNIILNAKIHAKIIYRSPVNPYTNSFLKQLETLQTAAIKKVYYLPANLSPTIIYLSKRRGGLGFPSIIRRDEISFTMHYLNSLNSTNIKVRNSTRDRIRDEFPKIDPMNINPNISDAHRFLFIINKFGLTVHHKPDNSKKSIIPINIWDSSIRFNFGPITPFILKAQIISPLQLLRNDKIIPKAILDQSIRLETTKEQYAQFTKAIINSDKSWTTEFGKLLDMQQAIENSSHWKQIIESEINLATPLTAWTESSFSPDSKNNNKPAAAFSFTIYDNEKIVKSMQHRIPGQQTIHRAEQTAVLFILLSISNTTSITIYTDSKHTIDTLNRSKHTNENSINSVNFDLTYWILQKLKERHNVATTTWKKVKSHSKLPKNDREHLLANEARNLNHTLNFEFSIIPSDTIFITDTQTPIFDIKSLITNRQDNILFTVLKASPKAWWFHIPNIDWNISTEASQDRWLDRKRFFTAQARSGSLRVATLLFSWNTYAKTYAASPFCPTCNLPQTIQHIPICSADTFQPIIEKYTKKINKKIREPITITIIPDIEINNPNRSKSTIYIGHYGAIHSETINILIRRKANPNLALKLLRKLVDDTIELTFNEWKNACYLSHQRHTHTSQ